MSTFSTATSLSGRLHSAFAKPLKKRCEELEKIIIDNGLKAGIVTCCSTKSYDSVAAKEDLHSSVSLIIEVIFGTGGQAGWDLFHIYKQQYEFDTVRRFLSPQGPFMNLLHRLVNDNYTKYDFPVSCLPSWTRSCLAQGSVPPFYSSKLHYPPRHGRAQRTIAVDAFELYFFHFAYHLLNSRASVTSSLHRPDDALYAVLVEDYLTYYLPTYEKSSSTLLTSTATNATSHANHQSPVSARGGVSVVSPTTQSAADAPINNAHTLVQIILDFWLRQHSYDDESFNSTGIKEMTELCFNNPIIWRDTVLPSTSHIRMLRLLIKHLHYFINNDVQSSSSYNSSYLGWGELKRIIPPLVQQPLYLFMRYIMRHWPLDASFRLVLEAWLSYIQPWRYQHINDPENLKLSENEKDILHPKWQMFIQENLLFYTSLFQNMLPQIFRMDLTVPKNAYMVFRVSKVFSQKNLRDYIYQADLSLCDNPSRSTHRGSISTIDIGASYLAPTPQACHLNLLDTTHTPTAIQHLEPNYMPMFTENNIAAIRRLLQVLLRAHQSAVSRLTNSNSTNDNGNTSMWAWLSGSNQGDLNASMPLYGYSDGYTDDYGGGSESKMHVHLKSTIENLTEFFQLDLPTASKSISWERGKGKNVPDCITTEQGPKLTPLGRYQVMNNICKFDIKYQGDPELQPIRSYEFATLARFLYHLCTHVNVMYSSQLSTAYHRADLLGGMARHFLQPPVPVVKRNNPITHPVTPRPKYITTDGNTELDQQPRISLRWLSSRQNLGYIGAMYLLAYAFMGLGPFSYVLLCFVLLLVYLFILAVTRPIAITEDISEMNRKKL